MDQIEDPHELEREIERASRLASGITDQTTYQRLKQFVEELRQRLHHLLAGRRAEPAPGSASLAKAVLFSNSGQ
jgi:hypothetical protein